jgi:O-antigen ligase/polysaccharide polymerase Wzy-like membrane protein
VSLVAGGRSNARTSVVPLGIGALSIAAAVSAVTAVDAIVALSVAAHLAVLAVFAAAAGDLVGTRGGSFWKVLSVTVIAQAALAVWQAVTQSTAPIGGLFNGWPREFSVDDSVAVVAVLPGIDRWLRAYGTFPHPNILGIFLAVALVVLSLRSEPSRLTRVAQLAGVVGLSLTFSRSAWLALSLATVTWVVTTWGWRGIPRWIGQQLRSRRVLAALVAIGLILAGARATQLDAFPEANSLSQRQIYDDAAWSLIAQGRAVGAGNILIAEQRQGVAAGEPAHNVFLITLAELGPIGALAWLALLATLVAAAWRRADPGGRGAAVAVAVLLPLLLLDHYLWTQPPGRMWLVLALAIIPSVTSVRSSER